MSSWKSKTLGDLEREAGGTIQTGPFGSQLHMSDYSGTGIPVVMPTNIRDLRIDATGIARVGDAHVERLARHKLRIGDIVYSRRGDVEKCALVTEKEEGWLCGTGCLLVRVQGSGVDSRFLSYSLSDPHTRAWISQHAVGATMPNLNTNILREVPVRIPNIEVQRAIAATLGALDDKIESNRRIANALDRLIEVELDRVISTHDFDEVIVQTVVKRLPVKRKHSGKTVNANGHTIVLDQSEDGVLGYHDELPEFQATPDSPISVFGDHTCTWRLGAFAFDLGPNVIPVVPRDPDSIHPLWLHFALRGRQSMQEYRRHWMEFSRVSFPVVEPREQCAWVEIVRPMIDLMLRKRSEQNSLQRLRDVLLPDLLSGRVRVPVPEEMS